MSILEPTVRSPLDAPLDDYEDRPFFEQNLALLRSVRHHDFDTLEVRCDDDHGTVGLDPSGAAVVSRSRTEWEHWFHQLFDQLDALDAETDSEILDYVAIEGASLGYSVLDFRQFLTIGDRTATLDCLATITWKRTARGWAEARWQASVISSSIPEGFGDQP